MNYSELVDMVARYMGYSERANLDTGVVTRVSQIVCSYGFSSLDVKTVYTRLKLGNMYSKQQGCWIPPR